MYRVNDFQMEFFTEKIMAFLHDSVKLSPHHGLSVQVGSEPHTALVGFLIAAPDNSQIHVPLSKSVNLAKKASGLTQELHSCVLHALRHVKCYQKIWLRSDTGWDKFIYHCSNQSTLFPRKPHPVPIDIFFFFSPPVMSYLFYLYCIFFYLH